MTATRFSEVRRGRRSRCATGDVDGFEVQRFRRSGHWLLFIWQRGEHGVPLIAADLSPRDRAALIRLLGGRP